MRVKFGVLEQTQGLHLCAIFHLNVFIVSASGRQKPQFLANFDIWGLLYRPPFIDEDQIWCDRADPWYMLTCQISSWSVYSVAFDSENPPKFCHFLDFCILWCRQLAAVWESWTRFHNYKPSHIQWYQNRFCTPALSSQNRAHNLWRSKAWL